MADRIGAHVDQADPIAEARARDAGVVQFFLGDPQSYKGPVVAYAGGAAALRADAEAAGVDLYVHSPYPINVAATNNRIRIPGRKLLQQHVHAAAEIGAKGVVVHGGHLGVDEDAAIGFDNWRKCVDGLDLPVPLLIENTAGGDNAMARRLEAHRPALGRPRPGLGRRPGRLLPRHLSRPRGRHRPGRRRRPGACHHRPDRPGARQRLPGRVRLRGRPAHQLRCWACGRRGTRGRRSRGPCAGHLRDARRRRRSGGRYRVDSPATLIRRGRELPRRVFTVGRGSASVPPRPGRASSSPAEARAGGWAARPRAWRPGPGPR